MTACHTIRLHAAWKRMVPECEGPAAGSVTVSLPDASLLECDASSVTYRRSFNRPTGITVGTVVLLASDLLPLGRPARLNGQTLPSLDSRQVEITALLLAHNELEIVLQRDDYRAASQAWASLQIIEPA